MGTLQTEAGWLHRLLATVRSRSIDDRLLAGEPANGDRVTLARRARLLDRRYRSAIAAALRRLLDAARRNQRNLFAANLPLQEEAVLESAPLILSLAAELEEEETVNPRGVILADRLIRDGSSPVYWPPPLHQRWEATVELAVRHARAALHLA